ncbi:MAG: AraC family transcriptional regulator [Actinomycetota bacterium]
MGRGSWLTIEPHDSIALRITGYRDVPPACPVHRGLPSGSITLIVSTGPPIEVSNTADASPHQRRRFHAVVGGLHRRPAFIHRFSPESGVAVDLRPDMVRRVFGIPAAALAASSVELSDVLGRRGDEFAERLCERATLVEQLAECERQLATLVDRHDREAPAAEQRAWSLLERSDGRLPISTVASDIGWSRQHLTRRFAIEYGISPRDAARVIRFGKSVTAMKTTPTRSLARVAADSGFSDQSHLTREWNDLAGCTPTQWRDEERVPSIQDTHAGR